MIKTRRQYFFDVTILVASACIVLILAVALSGCGDVPQRVIVGSDQIRQTIERSTDEFTAGRMDFGDLARTLPGEIRALSPKIANDLEVALRGAAMSVGDQALCLSDKLQRQVELFTLKNFIFGYNTQMHAATIPQPCSINRNVVVVPRPGEAPPTIEWNGSHLSSDDPSGQQIQAYLLRKNGASNEITALLNRNTQQSLSLTVDSTAMPLSEATKIILMWYGEVISEVGIIQPPVAVSRIIKPIPADHRHFKFIPKKIGCGDEDPGYYCQVTVKAEARISDNQLQYRVYAHFREPHPDYDNCWTEAEEWSPWQTLFNEPRVRLLKIVGESTCEPPMQTQGGTSPAQAEKPVEIPFPGKSAFVERFVIHAINGQGHDMGKDANVEVFLNPEWEIEVIDE